MCLRRSLDDDFVPYLRDIFDLGLDHEDAVEVYCNAAVTPWLDVSPSAQIINSGVNQAIDSSCNIKNLDTTYLVGVCVGIRF